MDNKTLLPCPFCGGEAEIVKYYKDGKTMFSDKYAVLCRYTGDEQGCGAEGQINKIKEIAIQAWNTRVEPKGLTGEENE